MGHLHNLLYVTKYRSYTYIRCWLEMSKVKLTRFAWYRYMTYNLLSGSYVKVTHKPLTRLQNTTISLADT